MAGIQTASQNEPIAIRLTTRYVNRQRDYNTVETKVNGHFGARF